MTVAEPVTEMIGGEPYRYYPLGDHVVRAPGVCGGRPTFKYTRIEITGALERLAAGEQVEEIVRGYEGRVPPEAMAEAVRIVTSFGGLVRPPSLRANASRRAGFPPKVSPGSGPRR